MTLDQLYRSRWRLWQPFATQYGVRVISYPFTEQISLQDAYDHLRLDAYGSPLERPDDDLINANITAAREWCEQYSGVALAPQILELGLGQFPNSYYWDGCNGAWITLTPGPVRG